MSLGDNKALVQQFIDKVINAGNTAAITEFCVAGSMFAGGIEGQIRVMKTAFPDHHLAIDEIVAEANKVAVRVTIHATNTGPLVGLPAFGRLETPVPPTGKSVTASGLYLFTVADGKILGYAAEFDQIGLLRQLGWTFTPPGTAESPTESQT
jgi:predicted ester cyclase